VYTPVRAFLVQNTMTAVDAADRVAALQSNFYSAIAADVGDWFFTGEIEGLV
jgi:hypothetical protein